MANLLKLPSPEFFQAAQTNGGRPGTRRITASVFPWVLACLGCSAATQGPDLVAEPNSIRLERPQGNFAEHVVQTTVKLMNRSRRDITLKNVTVSCDCLKLQLPKNGLIPAGTTIDCPIETSLPLAGARQVQIRLAADSNTIPPVSINVELLGTAVPAPKVLTAPREIRRPAGPDANSVFTVTTVEPIGPMAWLARLQPGSPWLNAEIVERRQLHAIGNDAAEYEYLCTVSWSSLPEDASKWFGAITPEGASPPVAPIMPIQIVLEKVTAITTTPEVLVLDGDGLKGKRLLLFADGQENWSCEPSDLPPGIQATREEVENALTGLIGFRVTWNDNALSNPSELTFKTSLPSQPVVRVAVIRPYE